MSFFYGGMERASEGAIGLLKGGAGNVPVKYQMGVLVLTLLMLWYTYYKYKHYRSTKVPRSVLVMVVLLYGGLKYSFILLLIPVMIALDKMRQRRMGVRAALKGLKHLKKGASKKGARGDLAAGRLARDTWKSIKYARRDERIRGDGAESEVAATDEATSLISASTAEEGLLTDELKGALTRANNTLTVNISSIGRVLAGAFNILRGVNATGGADAIERTGERIAIIIRDQADIIGDVKEKLKSPFNDFVDALRESSVMNDNLKKIRGLNLERGEKIRGLNRELDEGIEKLGEAAKEKKLNIGEQINGIKSQKKRLFKEAKEINNKLKKVIEEGKSIEGGLKNINAGLKEKGYAKAEEEFEKGMKDVSGKLKRIEERIKKNDGSLGIGELRELTAGFIVLLRKLLLFERGDIRILNYGRKIMESAVSVLELSLKSEFINQGFDRLEEGFNGLNIAIENAMGMIKSESDISLKEDIDNVEAVITREDSIDKDIETNLKREIVGGRGLVNAMNTAIKRFEAIYKKHISALKIGESSIRGEMERIEAELIEIGKKNVGRVKRELNEGAKLANTKLGDASLSMNRA